MVISSRASSCMLAHLACQCNAKRNFSSHSARDTGGLEVRCLALHHDRQQEQCCFHAHVCIQGNFMHMKIKTDFVLPCWDEKSLFSKLPLLDATRQYYRNLLLVKTPRTLFKGSISLFLLPFNLLLSQRKKPPAVIHHSSCTSICIFCL